MEFIHSVLAQDETVTAGSVHTWDLPVNPLSHILVTFKCAQDKADTAMSLYVFLYQIAKIEVLYKGSAIFSMRGIDAWAASLFTTGFEPWANNWDGKDNDEVSMTTLIPMGRIPYSPVECFPRTTRGELVLQITFKTPFQFISDTRVQIETVELPEASPERYLRQTTLNATPAAVGEFDIELPIGNPISGILVYCHIKPEADTDLATTEYAQILVDNQRRFYSHINYETWHNMAGMYHQPPGYWGLHRHSIDGAAYAQFMETSYPRPTDSIYGWWNYLPFDVFKDMSMCLETAGKSDVVLRIYAGVQETVPVIPCEIVPAVGGV